MALSPEAEAAKKQFEEALGPSVTIGEFTFFGCTLEEAQESLDKLARELQE